MGFEFFKESYAGAIKEITIGEGSKAVTIGGETCYPFYQFEGKMPHKPKIAMEVWDIKPDDWPESALSPFKEVIGDAARWAKKCVMKYNAEMIVLQLKSIDPNGNNASPEDASATVKRVLEAVDVPVILWGVANAEKDGAVFKKIAEDCHDSRLTLGPIEDKNHKAVGAAAMGYGHFLISSSPIDVNLAKQINILLENLGMPMDRVLIDPTTGGLGYGLEYSYSVMERLRMAALAQGDDKLQMPLINNLGNEIWKSKEAKQSVKEAPLLGDPEKRGILMEAVGAVAYLMAGSDILIMRHPESVRLVKSYIDLISDGGNALEIAPIVKSLDEIPVNLIELSPDPDLKIEVATKKVALVKKTPPVVKKSSLISKVAVSKIEKPVLDESECVTKVGIEIESELKAEVDVKLKAEAEAKLKAETEAKLKAEAEAKLKAEAEAKLKAEIEAKLKAEIEEVSKREAAEAALKEKRVVEHAKILEERRLMFENSSSSSESTPASNQKEDFEKIIDELQWIHKRIKLYEW